MTRDDQMVEIICPRCKRTEIIRLPREDMPKCRDCNVRMKLRELLEEGKAY